MIRLGKELELPDGATTQKFAFLARSGAGKTYAAGVLVEQLQAAGAQTVVVDGVGVWWGLRLAADGKKPGIPGIYVLGGQHADVPLESTGGALAADVIVDHGISCVLDVSEMNGAEQRRFVADFATHLLQRKKGTRTPVMVVWEECQDFVPQRVDASAARMVGAMERLIKQGRNFGVGTTLISQRPQAVNKDVLNQTEVLIVGQMTGPQERKTIAGWVVENAGTLQDAVDELPSLKRGEMFLWSPQWLGRFERIHIGKKWTFDASSTPDAATASAVRELAPVNLGRLGEAMRASVERAKADDPKALRAEVARLKAELAKKPAAKEKRVEVPAVDEKTIKRVEALFDRLAIDTGRLADAQNLVSELLGAVRKLRPGPPLPSMAPRFQASTVRGDERPAPETEPGRLVVRTASAPRADDISGPQQRMLDALAAFTAIGLDRMSRGNLAVFSDQSPRSSGYLNNLSALRSRGLVDYPAPSEVALTDAGRAATNPVVVPPTLAELHNAWCSKLSGPQARMLLQLVADYPQSVTREQLAEVTGQSPKSSGYLNNLSALRSLGVVDYPGPGQVVATALLFPAALR